MPQMAPLNWLILMFMLFNNFFIFNIINFYSFNYNIKIFKKMKSSLTYNWKW
ncbi:ATP synthase F0 subunit 8 (mitochondrion) [Anoplophora glabripennis]|uniref:ATP synthase complex subunit 8 n=1 Tax=Anoplophora glabripennis TaxID=217634 RepID=Q14V52_ANOGL|nr:ATP synthase F0 subunit 8 [Anoplophora glabripennis]ABG29171.1 ATP synthase F0 subunit 8 [Anoplophora glabripennis]